MTLYLWMSLYVHVHCIYMYVCVCINDDLNDVLFFLLSYKASVLCICTVTAFWCVVLLCLVVCFDLVCFFLLSFSSH